MCIFCIKESLTGDSQNWILLKEFTGYYTGKLYTDSLTVISYITYDVSKIWQYRLRDMNLRI